MLVHLITSIWRPVQGYASQSIKPSELFHLAAEQRGSLPLIDCVTLFIITEQGVGGHCAQGLAHLHHQILGTA